MCIGKTVWENLNDVYLLPTKQPFKAYGNVNPKIFSELIDIYQSIPLDFFFEWGNQTGYKGICLNYSPLCELDHINQYSKPYCEGLGGYQDSLSFYKYTDLGAIIYQTIGNIPFVRSKITMTKGVLDGQWHSDEDARESVKVVVPLTYDNNCYFQIEGSPAFNIEHGKALVFDSSLKHRVIKRSEKVSRGCLVLSIPVWFTVNDMGIEFSDLFGSTICSGFVNLCNTFIN